MGKKINALVLIGIIGTFVFGAHLVTSLARTYWGEQDIWWTHQSMRLSLDQGKDKVEVFFKDQLLEKTLASGKVKIATDSVGTEPLMAEDFSLRLNNLDKMRVQFLSFALFSSFFLGISIICLILGLAGFKKQE